MSRALAYVAEIKSLSPIPGADAIEKAEVLGWELVMAKKENFKVGDLIAYCEVDSILPELPPFEFLRPRKFRIRTIRLKNQISQGIAFPLSVINQVDPNFDISKLKIDDDVTDILLIKKYDPEAELDLEEEEPKEKVQRSWLEKKWSYLAWRLFGFKPAKGGGWPKGTPRTDETRVQKMGGLLERKAGTLCYITEKAEGTSSTFVYQKKGNWLSNLFSQSYTYSVCSRNRIIYNSDKKGNCNHNIQFISKKYDLETKMRKLNRNLAIQGETIGPKIQKNIYRLPEHDLRVFSVFDIDKQQYVGYDELVAICEQLELPMVPVVEVNHELKNDIKFYVEKSKRQSLINPKVKNEGIVVRAMDSSFSFKSINPEYLLSQES